MHPMATILVLMLLQSSPVPSDVVAESDLRVEDAQGLGSSVGFSESLLKYIDVVDGDGSLASVVRSGESTLPDIPDMGRWGRKSKGSDALWKWFLDTDGRLSMGKVAMACMALVALLLLLMFVGKKRKKASPPSGDNG